MTKQGIEFAFWALLIVAGATAIILYQHAQHSAAIAGAISTQLAAGGEQTIAQPPSNATGVSLPVDPAFGFEALELGSLGSLGA